MLITYNMFNFDIFIHVQSYTPDYLLLSLFSHFYFDVLLCVCDPVSFTRAFGRIVESLFTEAFTLPSIIINKPFSP